MEFFNDISSSSSNSSKITPRNPLYGLSLLTHGEEKMMRRTLSNIRRINESHLLFRAT